MANIFVTSSTLTSLTDTRIPLPPIGAPATVKTQHVSILMCTYNGARFIGEQLNSIEQQTHTDWTLTISDDGSSDSTGTIIKAFGTRGNPERLKVTAGPQQGFATNFISLTTHSDTTADFYAWADQDDVWHANKLETAIAWLKTIPERLPALYCGRCELIDESGSTLGHTPLFSRPARFTNALVQSIGGGNTMVFNQAARALLQEAGDNVVVASHDWWAYQLISGAGGIVHYDPQPTVGYRQHGKNLVGSNAGGLARLKRLRLMLKGRFCHWNRQNIQALETMQHRLTHENKACLAHFKAARNQTLLRRFASIRRAGLYRQTLPENLALFVAILFKKI